MADVRALLRAKREEAKITHPYAAYSQSGQLRCTVCNLLVKHASAWEGHLGSKAHRLNVARLREEVKEDEDRKLRETEAEALRAGKRKVDEQDEGDGDEVDSKKRKTTNKGFPADFFSDPNHAPAASSFSDSEDDDLVAPAQAPLAKSAIDMEYEQFQRELLTTSALPDDGDTRERYERATIAAEPELRMDMDGVPSAVPKLEQKGEDEEEARSRKEREERELIMDSLLEEERVQEEADMKVALLKDRIDAVKKKRATRLASRASKS